jgi:hypothetical protein
MFRRPINLKFVLAITHLDTLHSKASHVHKSTASFPTWFLTRRNEKQTNRYFAYVQFMTGGVSIDWLPCCNGFHKVFLRMRIKI